MNKNFDLIVMRIKSWIIPLNNMIENHKIPHFARNDCSYIVVWEEKVAARPPPFPPPLISALPVISRAYPKKGGIMR